MRVKREIEVTMQGKVATRIDENFDHLKFRLVMDTTTEGDNIERSIPAPVPSTHRLAIKTAWGREGNKPGGRRYVDIEILPEPIAAAGALATNGGADGEDGPALPPAAVTQEQLAKKSKLDLITFGAEKGLALTDEDNKATLIAKILDHLSKPATEESDPTE